MSDAPGRPAAADAARRAKPGASAPLVPRGTGPLPGDLEAAVDAVFGERRDLAQRYVDHLATTGVDHGLIGPREAPKLWERHLLNCAVVAERCPPGSTLLDVGSGAGLPGLAMAVARPDLTVMLVEPLQRRVVWLRGVIADLGVPVEVVRARAETCGMTADTVTARAVAPLAKLGAWCLPLVAPGGQLLALKGRSAVEELEAAGEDLRELGAGETEVLTAGEQWLAVPTTLVRVRLADAP